jgi:DNA recombination protein RmuC
MIPGATGFEWIYAGGGFIAGAVLATILVGFRGAHFKLVAQEAVKNAHEHFLLLAKENFKQTQADGAYDLDKRQKAIDDLVKPVQKQLEALSGVLEQTRGTDKALREDLKNLHQETSKLAGALRNPAIRGNWGEAMLERLLENSGLLKNVHYKLQVTLQGEDGRLRPDAVINFPDSLHIVIDSKAPINDFVRDIDADVNEDTYRALQVGLAAAVRAHISDLGKKAYWEHLNSPDFVVMFLPSEHLFSAAVQADPGLLDFAAERKVVIASPILTMSLLRVVGMSWRQVELAKNAQEISARGLDLYKRLLAFSRHVEKIGKGIQGAMKSYDDAVGSLQNVLPAGRKFRELQPDAGDELPELEMTERPARPLALSSDDIEEIKKRA